MDQRCFQSVKDIKFESNSQQSASAHDGTPVTTPSRMPTTVESNTQRMRDMLSLPGSCFQSVKDIKFESNSQLTVKLIALRCSCFQSVKDIKFESNSQLVRANSSLCAGCFQSVKDIKFESNSQLKASRYFCI